MSLICFCAGIVFSALLLLDNANVVDSRDLDFTCSDGADAVQAFCLPKNYTKQDRPNSFSDEKMYVSTGFIIDDVSDVDDDSCAVTLVLIMRFSWIEDRLVYEDAKIFVVLL